MFIESDDLRDRPEEILPEVHRHIGERQYGPAFGMPPATHRPVVRPDHCMAHHVRSGPPMVGARETRGEMTVHSREGAQ